MNVSEWLSPCIRCTIRRFELVRNFSCTSKMNLNHYEVLGVEKNASAPDIKLAYFEKSKLLHPDARPNDPNQHNRFVQLNEAYAVLSKPLSRRDYDLELAGVRVSPSKVRVYRADATNPFGADADRTHHDYYGFTGRKGNMPYYGVRGVGKMKNSTVLVGCMILLVSGTILHVWLVKVGGAFSRARLDEKDRKIGEIYNMVKQRARQNGNKKQIELLRQNYKEMTKKRKVMSSSAEDAIPKAT
ncbi:dnaJ homolog subfamily C member 4-like [Ptychodera flava]|uniref:dnaJ homolog subfamily C member 4-like n=1 Tax=Ptychodera flava TaxID=63121 RepID=UPI003969F6C4